MNSRHNSKGSRLSRHMLALLLFVIALNGLAGGYYGMNGAQSVPTEWLEGSPFKTYFFPGLILFTLIGCGTLASAILVIIHHRLAPTTAFVSGMIILIWIGLQVSIIGYVSWMQPAVTGIALLILLLSNSLIANQRNLQQNR